MPESGIGPTATVIPVPSESWPPDLLYIHFAAKVEELKSHLGDLRTADAKAVEAALRAAEKAVDAALAAAEKATNKYERDVERWREANNEWRATLVDREVKFLLIDTYNARMNSVDNAFNALTETINELRTFRDISLSLGPRLDALSKQVDETNDWRNKQLGRQQAQLLITIGLFALITFAARFLGG